LLDKGVVRAARVNLGDLDKKKIDQKHSPPKKWGTMSRDLQKFAKIHEDACFLILFFRFSCLFD